MKILALIKQVPDGNTRLVPTGSWIEEDGVAFVVNEFDLFALEAALQLKDADPSVEIVVTSVGPERSRQALRTALAMGADRAVILVDEAFQDGDPWSDSAALAAVARAEGPFDLVVAGLQASDDNFGQVGPLLAERLGVPCATGVMSLRLEAGRFEVERELEGDKREKVSVPMPCVLTFQTGAGDGPYRYANIKGIMAAKKKDVKAPTPGDIGVAVADVGRAGRRLEVLSLALPKKSVGAEMLTGSPKDVAQELVRRIREKTGVI